MSTDNLLLGGLAFLLLLAVFIYWGSMKWLKISMHAVPFDMLPDFLDGFRILHISDLHGNNSKKMNLNIWDKIETLEFDIAVITGDIIVNKFNEIMPHADGLKTLAARVPVFYVEGNHDKPYYSKITELFESIGITVLTNKSVMHTRGGRKESFEIIGVRDINSMPYSSYKTGEIRRLFEKKPAAGAVHPNFRLVLTHEPMLYDEIIGREQPSPLLVLAGHTHGGQIRLPLFPTLYAPRQGLFPKYGNGFYGDNNSKLYISRGVGTTVFPVRFWNRPEITVLELKSKLYR